MNPTPNIEESIVDILNKYTSPINVSAGKDGVFYDFGFIKAKKALDQHYKAKFLKLANKTVVKKGRIDYLELRQAIEHMGEKK